jgi:hypothetical protein
VERIPPGELSLEQLDALAAEGRIGLDRYWQLRAYLEARDAGAVDDRAFDLPSPPEPGVGGPGFVPPPPRRAAAPPPVPPPPPFVPPPPPPTGRADWVRLEVPGPAADAAPTRADDRAGRKRRRRGERRA